MKKLLSIILSLSFMLVFPVSSRSQAAEGSVTVEKPETYYSTLNNYYYQTEAYVNGSPDSVEFWIKLPIASFGGTVLAAAQGSSRTVWSVNAYGKLMCKWPGLEFTFSDSRTLADGIWHHVAVVRSDDAFTYYLDGELESIYKIESTRDYVETAYNFGAKKWDGNAGSPFEGFIKQVTIYEGQISHSQIVRDMNDDHITAGDNISQSAKLMGSWYLGDYWTERSYPASEENVPDVDLHSFEKFVEVEYDFDYDYTIAIIPDIQIMTNFNPDRLNNQMQWLVDNKERFNLQFACFVGDLSDYGQREYLYEIAADAMSILDNKLPYCFVPGNHDYDNNASTRVQNYFNKHFPVSKHSQLPGFGGLYEADSMANSYYTFNACGIDYLVLNLEYQPRLSVLRWATTVVEEHPNHRIMMNTHNYYNTKDLCIGEDENEKMLSSFNCTQVQMLYTELMLKHENIFFGFGGHSNNDEAVYRINYGENGNQVISMCLDMQVAKYPNDSALDVLMLIHVNEEDKTLYFSYYSPEREKLYNIQNLFMIPFGDSNNPTIGN